MEVLTVLFIIGVLSGFGYTRLRSTALRADASARLVRSTLQTQQRSAIARQSNTIVMFDTTRNGMSLVEDYNSNDTVNVGERNLWRPMSEGTRFQPPSMGNLDGTPGLSSLQSTDLRSINSLPAIIFRRDGSASSFMTIYLTARPTSPSPSSWSRRSPSCSSCSSSGASPTGSGHRRRGRRARSGSRWRWRWASA